MSNAARILVVEDNEMTRKMVRVTLQSEGYSVLEAEDGRTALDQVAANHPDLVLQDLRLPDIDGLDLVRRLRASPHGSVIPIIAFSGFQSKMEQARSEGVDFTDYVFKPINPSRLVETLRTHLGGPVEGPRPGRGRRVLVVDDDPVQLKISRIQLEQLGFRTETAQDGLEAISQARRSAPDAIVSDVLMPRLDGFNLCQKIRTDPALENIPVLLLSSAYVEEEDRALARRAGANAFILRTADGHGLRNTLLDVLNGVLPAPVAEAGELPTAEYTSRLVRQLERHTYLNRRLSQRVLLLEAQLAIGAGLAVVSKGTPPIETVTEDSLHNCFDAAGVSIGAAFLLDSEGRLSLQSQLGYPESAEKSLANCFGHAELLQRVMERQEPVRIPSPQVSEDVAQDLLAQTRVGSLLFLPLTAGEKSLGVLLVGSNERDLGDDWIDFVTICANHLAQSLGLAKALIEREEAAEGLRITLNSIGDAVIATDASGQITRLNPVAEQLTGWTFTDAKGRSLPEVFHIISEETRRLAENPVERVLRGGVVAGLANHTVLISRDGSERAIADSCAPIRDAQGKMRGVVLVFRDRTEDRKAERALRESEARKTAVMEAALDGIVMMDHEGRITEFNPAAERTFGCSRQDAVGKSLADVIIPPSLRLKHVSGLRRYLETGESHVLGKRIEVPAMKSNGIEFPAEVAVVRIRSEGSPVFAGYIRDITERRRAAEADRLRGAKEAAEEANAELEAFSYSVAHDLRAPLRAINGYATALIEDYGERLGPKATENLNRITSGAVRMAQLIDALLSLARLTRLEPRREVVDLTQLAHKVMEQIRANDPDRALDFVVMDGVVAEGDPHLLRVLLENLLGNAWKFTGKRTEARIEFGSEVERDISTYYVRDNGAGFDMTHVAKLFAPFRRLHSNEDFEGIGIGLSTVQRIVRRHGGRVWGEGAKNRGATFRFTLSGGTQPGGRSWIPAR